MSVMVEKNKNSFSRGKSGKPPARGGKPAGRGFGGKKTDRFEGDRPSRGGPRGASAGGGFKSKRDFGDRPARGGDSFGDKKPRRDFGDRPPRSRDEGGFERKPRSFGDRPARSGGSFGDKKPRRDFGDRPPRNRDEGGFERKPRRDFGDRPPRSRDEGGFERKSRSFGDRKPRDFGDRPPRGREEGGFERKAPRKFDDSPRGDKKTFQRNFERKKPEKRSSWDVDQVPRSFEEASPETRRKLKSDRPNYGSPSPTYLYGHHAVRAALLNSKRLVQRLMVTEASFENVREAYEQAQSLGLRRPEPVYVEKEDIERLLPRDSVHQDVLLDAQQPEEVFLDDVLNAANEKTKLLVLDQVTDPHNIGAILRSAAAFGAAAVVVQKLHAPDITGVLAKTASGAVEVVPIVRETNLNRALEKMKEAGFFCVGLDERGKKTVAGLKLKGKVALVLGAEGDGLRRLVAENCDELASLPTSGDIASLNVSNAAAVALYELVRK